MSDETEVVTVKWPPGHLAVKGGEKGAGNAVKDQADLVLLAFSILMEENFEHACRNKRKEGVKCSGVYL